MVYLVKEELQNLHPSDVILYEQINNRLLTNLIHKVSLKIFRQDKILRHIAKDRAQTRQDIRSFCEKFGLPLCRKTENQHQEKYNMLPSLPNNS